jgi:hypothetical protein
MGANLVKAALGPDWAHLPATPRLLLAHMALTAHDMHRQPKYFGGRDALVCVIYPSVDLDPKRREAQYRNVRNHLDVLKDAGVIRPLNTAHTRERAEYQLLLKARKEEEQNVPPVEEPLEEQNVPPEEEQNVPPAGGTKRSGEEEQNVPPNYHEEKLETSSTSHVSLWSLVLET